MKNIISIILLLSLITLSYPQQQSNWQNYANMKLIKSIIAQSDGIWAASKGGGFFYNLSDSSYRTFSKAEGLNGIDLTSVNIDKNTKVWFGSANGMLDVYNPHSNSFRSILDIFNSDKTNKQINDITISGDTVFLATDFGISLVDANNYFFYDTYFKFGSFTSSIKVNSVLVEDLIYAATESGVAIQKVGTTNLSAPESWDVYDTSDGLPLASVNKLTFYNSNLIAGTNLGLSIFDGTNWQSYLGLTGIKIIDLLVVGSSLYILTPDKVYLYDGNTLAEIITLTAAPTKLGYSSSIGILVATNKGIIKESSLLYPNGPAANQFPNMTVDKESNLWSASGKDASGVGIYKFDGTSWENYDVSRYPVLKQNGYYSIFCASDNTIYAGNWGQGFAKITKNNIQRFHSGNTDMVGIVENTDFIVITGFAEDSKNNIWILNLRAGDKKSLYMLTPDSVWYSFRNPLEQPIGFSEVKNLVIDENGTKWYTMGNEGSIGLFYYNEKGTYADLTDDVYGYLTTSKGLASNAIYSLAVDRRGDLWVGTSLGVNIISNVDALLASSNPQFTITKPFSVRQQTVNALAVDPLNQKWLGTNQGLFLLSTDGTQLLATLDTKNSP